MRMSTLSKNPMINVLLSRPVLEIQSSCPFQALLKVHSSGPDNLSVSTKTLISYYKNYLLNMIQESDPCKLKKDHLKSTPISAALISRLNN